MASAYHIGQHEFRAFLSLQKILMHSASLVSLCHLSHGRQLWVVEVVDGKPEEKARIPG